MRMCRANCFSKSKKSLWVPLMTMVLLLISIGINAQNGNLGIQEADRQVRGYFVDGTKLMYGCGALGGIIGAIKVYNKWVSGEPDTTRVASSWFGGCVFLVLVATVIKMFFGI